MYLIFFFNDTATTEIYTLSLHDALPICLLHSANAAHQAPGQTHLFRRAPRRPLPLPGSTSCDPPWSEIINQDRKSTRLNSSHANISYAVFCLKKKYYPTHRNSHLLTSRH